MIKGLSLKETIPYSLTTDEGEKKTIFHIGSIPARAKGELVVTVMVEDEKDRGKYTINKKELMKNAFEIFELGVKKIENFIDADAGGATVTIEKIDDDVMNKVGFEGVMEIAMEIVKINFVSEGERKK